MTEIALTRLRLILLVFLLGTSTGTALADVRGDTIGFSVLRDVDTSIGLSEVATLFERSPNLKIVTNVRSNYGERSLWLRIEGLGNYEVVRAQTVLDDITLFVRTQKSNKWETVRAGDQIAQSERQIASPFMALPVPDQAIPDVAYVRIIQPTAVSIKLSGWFLEGFVQLENSDRNLKIFLFGFIIATILYNMLVSALIRDPIFFFNALTVASLLVFALYLSGYGVTYFWSEWTGWSNLIFVGSIFSATVFGSVFMWQFLKSDSDTTASRWPILIGPAFSSLFFALSPLVPFWVTQFGILVGGGLLLVCTLLFVLMRAWRRDTRARILIVPLLFAVVPGFAVVALERIFGLELPRFSGNTLEITFCIEALLFSLALVARIRITEDAIRDANESVLKLKFENSVKGIESQDNERKRFAKELHDGVGQNFLTVIGSLRSVASKPEAGKLSSELSETADLATEALNEVRRISRDMHPASIEHLGLKRAIEVLLENVRSNEHIQTEFDLQFDGSKMTPKTELNVYRIIQESLSNITQHAEASWCGAKLVSDAETVRLSIEDDGVGFVSKPEKSAGLGLTSIDERVYALGGKWSILDRKPTGTVVEIEFPLAVVSPAEV